MYGEGRRFRKGVAAAKSGGKQGNSETLPPYPMLRQLQGEQSAHGIAPPPCNISRLLPSEGEKSGPAGTPVADISYVFGSASLREEPSSVRPAIAQQILELQELPTLPLVVTRIIQTTNDPRSSASDLNNLIMNDQAIAAKVLKLANSAFYGLPGKVNGLGRAVTLLGYNTVRALALSVSLVEAFQGDSKCPYFDREKFWEHSLAVAACARIIASRQLPELREEAHMAGLFHDIGKIILDQYFYEYFAITMRLAHDRHIPTAEAEQSLLGLDHAEVGAQVAERWNFPPHLVEAIRYHHDLESFSKSPLSAIVALSDALCQLWEFGDSGEPSALPIPEAARKRFCPTVTEMEILQAKLEAEVEKSAELLTLFR